MKKQKQIKPGGADAAAAEVDRLLAKIADETAELESRRSEYQRAVDELNARHKPIIQSQTILVDALALELKRAAKYYRVLAGIPPGQRIDMTSGAVIFDIRERVIRVKDILDRLERAGRVDLIRVAKQADWDALDALPDGELLKLDLEKVKKETFAYETRKP